jgi:phosphoribosyl-AMP cyclohydrolase / phosphoribosyl-ATP pyrophosphohydrolase
MNQSINRIELNFNNEGLIPVIVQSIATNEVLMLAYMNKEAYELTLKTHIAHYYSRSRKTIWKKGETSGHFQYVEGISYDCDEDALLLIVKQIGVACHTGNMSCFYRDIIKAPQKSGILDELYDIIKDRKENPIEGSYTTYLFEKGIDKILKKVGEETSEVIIGSKNNNHKETVYEIADLAYHVLVLMVNQNIKPEDIRQELSTRRK